MVEILYHKITKGMSSGDAWGRVGVGGGGRPKGEELWDEELLAGGVRGLENVVKQEILANR